MKYKEGDKVRILVGDDSHKAPHYLGYKGVIGTITGEGDIGLWAVLLPNDSMCYYKEDEIVELVVSPQVGDMVEVINKGDQFHGRMGEVTEIIPYLPYPWYVKFASGHISVYRAEELKIVSKKPAEPKVSTAETRFPPKMAATCTMTLLDKTGQPYEALFVDVGVELFRSYLFPATLMPDGRVFQERIVRVDNPKWLYVAPSGSHRIVDKDGRSHYIPAGWKHLWWLPENGQPPFVK